MKVFDMKEIRDPSTLEIRVLQDWHKVEGVIETRQKLVSINVGDIWPGQEYRVPVRHGCARQPQRPKDFTSLEEVPHPVWKRMPGPTPTSVSFWRAELASVITVVQEPGTYGQRALSQAAEKRFAETLNPRVKIQYWAWPATLMRAITAAYAEKDHFEKGKVAASGGSKNGASPSMAIIHDDRMTAVHATVSPIWDSPLRLNDEKAWNELRDQPGRRSGFTGGHFGPNFQPACSRCGGHMERTAKFHPGYIQIKYSYPETSKL
jgi:hypothetical protein